jgi:hypothetical protein
VTIAITYTVPQQRVEAFLQAAAVLRQMRRRTGATRWRLYRSGEDAQAMVETFVVPSWAEYRRAQTRRLTGRDREIRQDVIDLSEGTPTELHLFPPEVHPHRGASESPKK